MRTHATPLLWAGLMTLAACSNDIHVAPTKNIAPTTVITSPEHGATVEEGVVGFVGTIADGNGISDINTVTWTSSVDGQLSDPETGTPDSNGQSRISAVLSPGLHAITLRATDYGGLTGEDVIELNVVVADQMPKASISSPNSHQEFWPGQAVNLIATVSDPQQSPDTLDIEWAIRLNSTGATEVVSVQPANNDGVASATWTAAEPLGGRVVVLTVTDDDGNQAVAEVPITVVNGSHYDMDGDGYCPHPTDCYDGSTPGDCDDTDANIYPGAPEVCGNAKDDNCSGYVDDKDNDDDGFIDEECINYNGPMPGGDCDDEDPEVYPGAPEQEDGKDNNCDGFIDNVGPHWDHDGDCYCELEPCSGSNEQDGACAGVPILGGDCDETDPDINPGVYDTPDPDYLDANCDGIDGDLLDSVFLDPVGGLNTRSGLTPSSPVQTLDKAYEVAVAEGRSWILVSEGDVSLSGDFIEGVHLAGGYDAGVDWERYAGVLPLIGLPYSGRTLVGWSAPTEWHQIEVRAGDATLPMAASVTLTVSNSNALVIVDSVIGAGNGGAGYSGSTPSKAGNGSGGGTGVNGFSQSGCCPSCNAICWCCGADCSTPRPARGTAGAACSGANNGYAGGIGGWSDHPQHGSASNGAQGGSSGGAGGTGNNNNSGIGGDGGNGGNGNTGTNGPAGGPIGVFDTSNSRYGPAHGSSGGAGTGGRGGGGGGGGGKGGWQSGNCSTWGGAGGGGGGGGCGGGGGGGGTGGGASVALVLLNGSGVTLIDTALITGNGGNGGNGAAGGQGGDGGQGGQGGAGDTSYVNQPSGPGGRGGNGGAGGQGGHGGGGGGGPSIGVVCQGGGNALNQVGTVFNIGSPGSGGTSPGANGQTGRTGNTDGC